MEVIQTKIPGVVILEPKIFGDVRGYFFESFSQKEFDKYVAIPNFGKSIHFVQDNESMSSYGVMRGLHFQAPPFTQSKLVRCVKGAVLDVAVDIRKGSPTYGQHVAVLLAAHDEEGKQIVEQFKAQGSQLTTHCFEPGLQFFVPRGFAHGFAVLSETAVFQYKCDNFYAPQVDGGISILDQSLGIDWHIPTDQALLSDKDLKHVLLEDFDSPFHFGLELY